MKRDHKISNPGRLSSYEDGILQEVEIRYLLWIIQVVRSNNKHESSIGCSDAIRNSNSNRMRPDWIVRPDLCGKQKETILFVPSTPQCQVGR